MIHNKIRKITALAIFACVILSSLSSCNDSKLIIKNGSFDSNTITDISNFKRQDSGVIEACVKTQNGVPRLLIDGKVTPPLFFWGNTSFNDDKTVVANEIKLAKEAGINVVMTETDFSTMVDDGVYNFKKVQKTLDFILANNPDAQIVIRAPLVQGNAAFWESLYPGEQKVTVDGVKCNSISVASDNIERYGVNGAKALVNFILSEPKYAKAVIGYHFSNGEWFQPTTESIDASPVALEKFKKYLKNKYKTDDALKKAWSNTSITFEKVIISAPPGNVATKSDVRTVLNQTSDQKFIDYYEFYNQRIAYLISQFSKATKEASKNRSLVFVFYGYTFEVCGPKSGHAAMATVLEDPNVDVICSPLTYQDRLEGGIGGFMSLADSLAQNNKIWIMENDTRTKDSNVTSNAEPDAAYNQKTKSIESAIEIEKREMGLIISRNIGQYWMDLWGTGWLNDKKIWDSLKPTFELYQNYAKTFSGFQPEVAIVVDESSILRMANPLTTGQKMFYEQRSAIYRSGVTFGLYETKQAVSGKLNAKLYIFLNPWDLSVEEQKNIQSNLISKGKTIMWMSGFGNASSQTIQKLTGMNIKSVTESDSLMRTTLIDGDTTIQKALADKFGAFKDDKSNPYFYVEDSSVTALGKYDLADKVSFALKEQEKYKSVFYGGISLSPELIRAVSQYAGVNIYCDSNDVLTGNNNFLTIHASSDGQKSIKFDKSYDVYDFFEKKWYVGSDIKLDMKKGNTKYLIFGIKKTIEKNNLTNKS